MLPYRDNRLLVFALIVFFVFLLGYAYFEAQGLLFGPKIDVPSASTTVHESLIIIKGQAERITALYMNGKQIPTTENGSFEQPFLLAPGYNYITLEAQDRAGRKTEKRIEVVYEPLPEPLEASSTAPLAP